MPETKRKSSPLKLALKREGFKFSVKRDDSQAELIVKKDGEVVANAILMKSYLGVYKVATIEVLPEFRRKKLGTVLYEDMTALSCEEKMPVRSDELRSRFAEAFWRKQEQKGRATCFKTGSKGDVYREPEAVLENEIRLKCASQFSDSARARECTEKKLSTVYKDLPQPAIQEGWGSYWPCSYYELKPDACGSSLEGMKRRRSRRKKKR